MKKMLSILAAVGLTATAATSVVACSGDPIHHTMNPNFDRTEGTQTIEVQVKSGTDLSSDSAIKKVFALKWNQSASAGLAGNGDSSDVLVNVTDHAKFEVSGTDQALVTNGTDQDGIKIHLKITLDLAAIAKDPKMTYNGAPIAKFTVPDGKDDKGKDKTKDVTDKVLDGSYDGDWSEVKNESQKIQGCEFELFDGPTYTAQKLNVAPMYDDIWKPTSMTLKEKPVLEADGKTIKIQMSGYIKNEEGSDTTGRAFVSKDLKDYDNSLKIKTQNITDIDWEKGTATLTIVMKDKIDGQVNIGWQQTKFDAMTNVITAGTATDPTSFNVNLNNYLA